MVRRQSGGYPITGDPSLWLVDTANSAWIGPGDVDTLLNGPKGLYRFQTTFDLPLDGSADNIRITGRWAADNFGVAIVLNGFDTGLAGAVGFNLWTSFDLKAPGPSSLPLVAGTNTIQFLTYNNEQHSGVRVEIGTAFYATAGAWADPHFIGLNGEYYDFNGEINRTFALISDELVEVNAYFVPYDGRHTLMGAICVRSCDDTMVYFSDGRVLVNGSPFNGNESSSHFMFTEVMHDEDGTVYVRVPGWNIKLAMDHHSIGHVPYLDISHIKSTVIHSNVTHGVLGYTLRHAPEQRDCNPVDQGGCQLPGKWQEYEITSDGEFLTQLCSPVWKNSQFNPAKCASHKGHTVAPIGKQPFVEAKNWQ
jgi:hypothetical protein